MSTRFLTTTFSALILMAVAAPIALAETTPLQQALTEARILQGRGEDIIRPSANLNVDSNLVASPASDLRPSFEISAPLLDLRADSEANSRR
ncbi:MAG: hypothetical protein HC921_03555 [Synechococcaceae cyanobacterium SM2_3_1]|nr:hypothetical protein [Synechococcaceae cyanobacterium SM2_3_1]